MRQAKLARVKDERDVEAGQGVPEEEAQKGRRERENQTTWSTNQPTCPSPYNNEALLLSYCKNFDAVVSHDLPEEVTKLSSGDAGQKLQCIMNIELLFEIAARCSAILLEKIITRFTELGGLDLVKDIKNNYPDDQVVRRAEKFLKNYFLSELNNSVI